MTTATLRLATPTPFERVLQKVAAALSRHVDARVLARAEQRDLAMDVLREQQTRKQDPRALEHLLAQVGLPGR